jgi:biopolymer transport protein ExbD
MPVKLGSKLSSDTTEARIEIIPLIDIMFFLLASFMLVSLSMVNMKSLPVNLPTATTATAEAKKNFLDISIDRFGGVFLDKRPVASNELVSLLAATKSGNPDVRVFISADRDATHGRVIHVLDLVRQAGIDQVAFEIGQSNSPTHP